jgi:hypothetical protein
MRSAANFFLISVSTAALACAFGEPANASWKRDMIIGADAGYCLSGKLVANVRKQCPEFNGHGGAHKKSGQGRKGQNGPGKKRKGRAGSPNDGGPFDTISD